MKFFGSVAAVVDAVLLTGAQVVAGVKTFTSAIVAAAGIQLASLWNTNGTGASDVCLKVGTSTADGSVDASAKLLSVGTGVGGAYVEKLAMTKDSLLVGQGASSNSGKNLFAVAGGVINAEVTKGLSDITPGIQVRTSTGQAGSLAVGTNYSSLSFSSGGYFAIVSEPRANFDNGTVGGGSIMATIKPTGELEVTTAGAGVVLKSPDGTRYKLTVANGGALSVVAI